MPLDTTSRAELSDSQGEEAIATMRSYDDDGKAVYGAYFRRLANFLDGIGASYRQRSAAHLDLVQESTDPVWSSLSSDERSRFRERDLPFLIWQLGNLPNVRVAVCAGKTVSDHIQARASVVIKETGSTKLVRWWLGTAQVGRRHLAIGGWNYPLDRPTGLGTVGEIQLGQMFARALL